MDRDLEYSITQYLDGALSAAEREALEIQLSSDAEARALLEEYRRLDMLLKSSPMPDMRWDALAEHISAVVAEADADAQRAQGFSLKMPWLRVAVPLALAASLFLVFGLSLHFSHRDGAPPLAKKIDAAPAALPALAIITGPAAEAAEGPVEVSVLIGPAVASADDSLLSRYSDDVVSRPSRITVASGFNPPHDTDLPPAELQ